MSDQTPVKGLALHRLPRCNPTDHARLQFCSANLNMFLHNLAGCPHRLVKLKFRDCLKHRFRSSQLLPKLHLQQR